MSQERRHATGRITVRTYEPALYDQPAEGPVTDIGKASGTLSTMRQLGGAFGVAVLLAVFAGAGGYSPAQAFNDGFVAATAAGAGLSVVGALAGIAVPRPRQAEGPDPAQAQVVPALETERTPV